MLPPAMFGDFDSRNEYQPFGYLGRIPLYLTTILVIVYSVIMALLVLLPAAHVPNVIPFANALAFDSDMVLHHFQVWRLATYPILNAPSLWFAVEMYFLYSFGREVERFLGRTSFGVLYLLLVVFGPCLLSAIGPWSYTQLVGSSVVNFAVFIAFATIYPNAEIFFTLRAKWIAAVLIGIFTLIDLRNGQVLDLMVFLATCLAAFLFIKYLRGQIAFRFSLRDYLRLRRSRRNLRAVPEPPRAARRNLPPPGEDVLESIDPLLDKIAKHGIGSLTDAERQRLEKAREELLKKGI